MKKRIITAIGLAALSIGMLVAVIVWGGTPRHQIAGFETPGRDVAPPKVQLMGARSPLASECAIKPVVKKPGSRTPFVRINPAEVTLDRFRQLQALPPETLTNTARTFTPREVAMIADASNFGDRYFLDVNGKPALLEPVVVIHETVGSANSALNMFRTYHPLDDDQVSYHTLIRRDGTIVYVVPPDKRAYGAGNSVFASSKGNEAVRTNATLPPSVNNFAYHISLETPGDGNNNNRGHSGYTYDQYQSLAWIVSKTGVTNDRITTHRAVDRSRSRMDPRSFDRDWFFTLLNAFPRTNEINPRCTPPNTVMQ